jgi:hypothetical protein
MPIRIRKAGWLFGFSRIAHSPHVACRAPVCDLQPPAIGRRLSDPSEQARREAGTTGDQGATSFAATAISDRLLPVFIKFKPTPAQL